MLRTVTIDRFFMQVRRRLSLLERPISTSSKAGRTWYGYSAYQPESIEKVLEIFRVFYNYRLGGEGQEDAGDAARAGGEGCAGGAWSATVHGIAQSRTRLKRLSSSSSSFLSSTSQLTCCFFIKTFPDDPSLS